MTDLIAAARAVLENDLSIMLLCETCPDECNCHPPADMWRRRESGKLICEGCADVAAMPVEDLHHAPRPGHVIRALLVALEAERAKVAAAYEAAATLSEASAERNKTCPSGCRCADGWHIAMRIRSLTPADAESALDKLLAEARLKGWRVGRDAAADAMQPALRSMLSRGQAAAAIRAMPEPKEASHD